MATLEGDLNKDGKLSDAEKKQLITKRLGAYGSQYLINYFKNNPQYTLPNPYGKTNYPISIYEYLQLAAQRGEDAGNVSSVLKGSNWYGDANKRERTGIAVAAMENGLDEIANNEVELDRYRDMILNGVKTLDEIKYEFGNMAIGKYGLATTKPDIAKAIAGGKSFAEASASYLATYANLLGLDSTQVSVSDPKFRSVFTAATSLDDFTRQVRKSRDYLDLPANQVSIKSNLATLRQKYAAYGQGNVSDALLTPLAESLLVGDTTEALIDEKLRVDAANEFTPFRDRILAGESPLSIASPYISAMSRILEIPSGAINLNDTNIRSAMSGTTTAKGDNVTSTAMPLWQFEQNLYKDSRWQYTTNAKEKLDSITLDVLSRFGLVG